MLMQALPWLEHRRARLWFQLIFVLPLLLLLAACPSIEPVQRAETPEQKAFALYGTFVIMQEQGAKIVLDETTPAAVVRAIQAADRVAHPASKVLNAAAQQLQIARARLRNVENQTTLQEFEAALAVFNERWNEDAPKLRALIAAVEREL